MFPMLIALAGSSFAVGEATPVELGKVPWLRDYNEALAQAKKTKKPLLILFQEVPG